MSHAENEGLRLSWNRPNVEMLSEYLSYHRLWDPSYTRQRMLPMFSTIFFRERILNPVNSLLCDQYEFDSIQRIKAKLGQKLYVIKWKKQGLSNFNHANSMAESVDIEENIPAEVQEDVQADVEEDIPATDVDESIDLLNEPSAPVFQVVDGCVSFNTDEDMELVKAAFPEKVEMFNREEVHYLLTKLTKNMIMVPIYWSIPS